MNNITDIILRLPAITAVSIETTRRNMSLYPLKKVTHQLQMSYYWLKHANEEMKKLSSQTELIVEETDEEHKLVIPTLLGTPEQLEYIRRELEQLGEETYTYINDVSLPQGVRHKVEQSYNCIMTALFNTELSTTYYEQLSKQSGYPEY